MYVYTCRRSAWPSQTFWVSRPLHLSFCWFNFSGRSAAWQSGWVGKKAQTFCKSSELLGALSFFLWVRKSDKVMVCYFVLCIIKPILGDRYRTGVSPNIKASLGASTQNQGLPTCCFALSSLKPRVTIPHPQPRSLKLFMLTSKSSLVPILWCLSAQIQLDSRSQYWLVFVLISYMCSGKHRSSFFICLIRISQSDYGQSKL